MAGVYHSAYDTLAWYEKFGDPGMAHTRVFTQMMAMSIARLADAAILPFEYKRFAGAVDGYLRELQPMAASVDLDPLREELGKLKRTAGDFESAMQNALKSKASAAKLATVNSILLTADRALLIREGLPGRPWYRHSITAPGQYTGYGAKTLPGVREQIELGRIEEARKQVKLLEQALADYRVRITAAAKALAAAQ
jgi:N-acetylated-alpha-linked acidic dipeptidase